MSPQFGSPHPQYVPDFGIQINGQDIPSALRSSVTSVRYQQGRNASDRVEIGLANTNLRWLQQHIVGLGFSPFPSRISLQGVTTPSGLFDIDNKLTLSMGYVNQLQPMFEGEITGVEASFPSGGAPTMTIVAQDYLARLGKGSWARGFGPLPDFLIAMILGAENLLIPLIDPTIIVASGVLAAVNYVFGGTGTKQKGQSDLEFLSSIAAKYDSEFYVEGNVLWVTRFLNKEYSPRLTLTWGESLMDFSPKVSTVGESFGVGFKFTLREIPLDFLVTVFYDFDREAVGIMVVPGAAGSVASAVGGPVTEIINRCIGSPADIATSAMEIAHELRQKLNNRLTGTGTCVGDTRIRAGAMICIDGIGPDFSGNYRVANATHSMRSSGYTTSFEVRKELIP